MILDINKAKELGEALIDAYVNAEKRQTDQAVVCLGDIAVAVPLHPDIQDIYNTVAIIKV